MALGLLAAGGCDLLHCEDLIDPCYPERYEYMARQEVHAALAPQMHNGDVLDRTVWNYHFEPGSDKLTVGGQDQLKYLLRQRPCPQPVVFLQTAEDLSYDPAMPEKYVLARAELNHKRIQAVQNFLVSYSSGAANHFQVVVHDPPEVGFAAAPLGGNTGRPILPGSWQKSAASFGGQLPRASTAGVTPTLGSLTSGGG